MFWLTLAIIGYFLNAIVAVIDRSFLLHRERNPLVYSFCASILGGVVFVLWFFDFSWLSSMGTLMALVSGISFFLAIYFFYLAMSKGEVAKVVSVIGGVSPLLILLLSYLFLSERLPIFWLLSLALLVSGSFILSLKNGRYGFEIDKKLPLYSCVSAVFFAVSFFSLKFVFLETSFLNGLVWTRIGAVAAAVFVFLKPSFRLVLKQSSLLVSRRVFSLFVLNKSLSALAVIILNYAIMLGSVTIVNAVQGVQYAFLFGLTFFLSVYYPNFLKESFVARAVAQKIIGITLISLAIILLFIV